MRKPITAITINKVKLALPAGAYMFQNRIICPIPNVGMPQINTALLAAAANNRSTNALTAPVQTMDIYQAAKNRAIEDHELDKLFNPELYDDEI